ncbi:diguanylate cyclase [Azospirillum baldaniorum]|uniref:Diguanylate cyclase/phosphodiesterase n=1 Tax=Azospirillum baldaniorum TaxID=1064539 RepID=A0A9P1NLS7_9PROT|nr:EAL domain-containing protein [Azospirillum baldaniorum]AWJ90120.1 diguanylate cyclase [Azospirillum baldaniorum]TWA77336.1 PAS domain S-box-containing protein/diguanylate cyclase (GGDEF)-like protein [Azospirillum brasilense]CCC97824.1 diguanylate cyclase/phosphodiesterase [Azospirillum baldaniorum]
MGALEGRRSGVTGSFGTAMQRSSSPDPIDLAPSGSAADSVAVPKRLPLLALLAALLLTALAWHDTRQRVAADAESRFALRVEELHRRFENQIQVYVQVTRSAAALFTAYPEVKRTEWNRFVDGLHLAERFPGITAVAFARVADQWTSPELVTEARMDGLRNFRIWPESTGPVRLVTLYAAPVNERTLRTLGYDLLSEPVRRAAAEQARDSGEPAVTRAVALRLDEGEASPPAFIVFQAVYRDGLSPATQERRRATFAGLVMTPIHVAPLAESVFGRMNDIAATVFEGRREFPLYRSRPEPSEQPLLTASRDVTLGSRVWSVQYESRPSFEDAVDSWKPTLVLATGLSLSVLLSTLLWALAATRDRALVIARRITTSLRRRETELDLLFNQAPLGIALIGPDAKITDCNPAFARAVGVGRDGLIGIDTKLRAQDPAVIAAIDAAIAGESVRLEVDRLLLAGGRHSHFSLHLQPVSTPGDPPFVMAFVEDIGDKRRAEQHIHYLAHYDPLTGLPNRVLLFDRIAQAARQARRDGGKVAVLFIDLDHFKVINDSLGHSFGDEVLRSVARRLHGGMRPTDTVGRLGGDEFLIVVPAIQKAAEAAAVAEKVLAQLAAPFAIGGRNFVVSPSIGISLFPDDAEDAEGLIRCADIAMYNAKDAGRNAYRFVTREMGARSRERLDLEAALRRALQNRELFLVYQPQLRISDDLVVGVEALLRWRHPEAGLIMPNRFLPVAEETGLIQPIGDWVLDEVCAQIGRWRDQIGLAVPVAVNVSAQQFRDGQLPAKVAAALDRNGLQGWELEIEVTEGTLIDDIPSAIATLRALKQRGCLIALDDFGTGYSSLNYLHRFPIDKLKIDRSFIHDLEQDGAGDSIPRAIVGLGRSLGLSVVAEGVETEAQLQLLRSLKCESFQGYLFSRPVLAEELEPILALRAARGHHASKVEPMARAPV